MAAEEGSSGSKGQGPTALLEELKLEPSSSRLHVAGRLRSTPRSRAKDEEDARAALKAKEEERARKAAEAALAAAGAEALGLPPVGKRVFLVTGATDGIGRFTAELLAKEGCEVIIHGRAERKIKHMMGVFYHDFPGCRIDGFEADLSLMKEVREFASLVSSRYPVIHGILHNAATMDGDYKGEKKLTKEDLEHTMAVNALAPFLLTSLLMPNLRASGAGRVIFSSSAAMSGAESLNDLILERKWSGIHAYRFSKLCNSMVAAEMHERFGDAPRFSVHAIEPGLVDTKLMRQGASWGKGARRVRQRRKTDSVLGLVPHVRTATASFEALTQNRFQEASGLQVENSPPEVNDASKRAQLWEDMESLTGADWSVPAPTAEEGA